MGLSALLIVITIFLYRKYGKDPDNGRPIVTEFTPPKGISLLEASYILNEKIELKALGSELIEQARLGNLIIEARENNHFLGVIKNISFTLIIIKSPVDKVAALLVSFLAQSTKVSSPQPYRESAPFLSGISPSIGESSDRTNRVNIDLDKAKIDLLGLSKINSSLERSLLEKGLFDNMLGSILKKFFGVVLTFFITYVLSRGIALPESPYALVLVVVIILCVITLTRSLNRKTAHGVDIKYQLLGLKRYIDIAEEERIAFHNAPSKTPEYYLELLPWAMLFGLEKKWSKEFEGISFNQNDVSFYRSNTPFSSAGFTSGLGASMESFSTVASQAATVAYSGGGGRGGGGFSGGGGGGGGGRSW